MSYGKTSNGFIKQRFSNDIRTGYSKTIEWYHRATSGDTFIDLTNLSVPSVSVVSDYTPPTYTEILSCNLLQNSASFKLISSLKGLLIKGISYRIVDNTTIQLNFSAEADEIFYGIIEAKKTSATQIVDGIANGSTGVITSGSSIFNTGYPFEVNKNSNSQIGSVLVFLGNTLLFRCASNNLNNVGDYIELDGGSGVGNQIQLKKSVLIDTPYMVIPIGVGVNNPTDSQNAVIETLAGQVQRLIDDMSLLTGNSTSAYQGAPNYVDLKTFGDMVIDLYNGTNITSYTSSSGLINYPMASGNWGDLTSITIPPGTYDISAMSNYYNNGTAVAGLCYLGIGTTSGSTTGNLNSGVTLTAGPKTATNGDFTSLTITPQEYIVTANTTFYLKTFVSTSTNLQIGYKIFARKIK